MSLYINLSMGIILHMPWLTPINPEFYEPSFNVIEHRIAMESFIGFLRRHNVDHAQTLIETVSFVNGYKLDAACWTRQVQKASLNPCFCLDTDPRANPDLTDPPPLEPTLILTQCGVVPCSEDHQQFLIIAHRIF